MNEFFKNVEHLSNHESLFGFKNTDPQYKGNLTRSKANQSPSDEKNEENEENETCNDV